MDNFLNIHTDFYFEYEHGQVNAKIPGIVATMGETEEQAVDMLEMVFEFLLKRWQKNGVLNSTLMEHQFEFENNEWKRTLEHKGGTISIKIEEFPEE